MADGIAADPAPAIVPRTKPFRFLADPGVIVDGAGLRDTARRAEAMGFSVLVLPDHVVAPFGFVPLLAAAAAVTDRLRVAPFVANNDFRHPALLAQDLATIDVLSGGRVEVAVGAGWNRPEYDALGIAFDPVGVRVSRLAEAVTVLKGCFGDGPFSFAGEHYTITDHDGIPKPVQRPHPPLFIGGGGRRVLSLAGREADIVGLAPRTLGVAGGETVRSDPRSITIAATEEKIAWVREAAGDRFDRLELNVYPTGSAPLLTDHPRKAAADILDGIRARTGIEVPVDEYLASPHVFIGSVDGLVAKLRRAARAAGDQLVHGGRRRHAGPGRGAARRDLTPGRGGPPAIRCTRRRWAGVGARPGEARGPEPGRRRASRHEAPDDLGGRGPGVNMSEWVHESIECSGAGPSPTPTPACTKPQPLVPRCRKMSAAGGDRRRDPPGQGSSDVDISLGEPRIISLEPRLPATRRSGAAPRRRRPARSAAASAACSRAPSPRTSSSRPASAGSSRSGTSSARPTTSTTAPGPTPSRQRARRALA